MKGNFSKLPFCEVFATFWAAKAGPVNRAADSNNPNRSFRFSMVLLLSKDKLAIGFVHIIWLRSIRNWGRADHKGAPPDHSRYFAQLSDHKSFLPSIALSRELKCA